MRILGVTEKWDKLKQPQWTTFRFTRRDRDWEVGEVVQVVYKPRRKGGGEKLGVAKIIGKEPRWVTSSTRISEMAPYFPQWANIPPVSDNEAEADGFPDRFFMWHWADKTHKGRNYSEPMNKLTLQWVERG